MLELVAGVDEAGRGAWFGAVVAGAVVFPAGTIWGDIRDSKRLSASRRGKLAGLIRQKAVAWAIGQAEPEEIDRLNILQASLLAMERAIANLSVLPHHCLIDGREPLRWQETEAIPQTTIVGGDGLSVTIGAASIVAKVYRDELMVAMAEVYPGYDLANNKGYGTPRHREGIARLGLTVHHRRSFRLS